MSPERWLEVKSMFDRAVEYPPAERAGFLDAQCAGDAELRQEVESLLDSDEQAGSLLERPAVHAAAISGAAVQPALVNNSLTGRTIGPYAVIREIGRGGMGFVYLAQRADDQFRRRVALKAVYPNLVEPRILRRFENERQMLASLDHPNIVKLLDGGTTDDGLPWLVMDYIEGQPIDRYCETHNLTVDERLALFRTVCGAVHYAHQNLVIHRDLKPGNILVTEAGVPKLLDFGIAKLTRSELSFRTVGQTRTDAQPMTPEYASPEQIRGLPLTTATDIYSLGVLLYRLVTGRHPYPVETLSMLELERAICETDPEKPSTAVRGLPPGDGQERSRRTPPLSGRLASDLDLIVLMAMRKEPQRRYASAEHMAEDIRRLLENRPVLARKDTWTYRLTKFVSRHVRGTIAATLAVIAVCVLAAIAYRQYVVAKRRAVELRQFAQVTMDLDDAQRTGLTATRAKMLGKAVQSLDKLASEASGDTDLQRDLLRAYLSLADLQGNMYAANLGEKAGAEATMRKALAVAETLRRNAPNDPKAQRDVAVCNIRLGDILAGRTDSRPALGVYTEAKRILEPLLAADPDNTELLRHLVVVTSKIGNFHGDHGDPTAALDTYRTIASAAQHWASLEPERLNTLAYVRERTAYYAMKSGEAASAEPIIREALDVYRRAAGASPRPAALRNIAQNLQTLSEVQKRNGQITAAIGTLRESLGITEGLLERDAKNVQYPADRGHAWMLLIDLLLRDGQRDAALSETRKALEFLEPRTAPKDASVISLFDHAWIIAHTPFKEFQDPARALDLAKRTVEASGDDVDALALLAIVYEQQSKPPEAIRVLEKALAQLPPAPQGRAVPELRKTIEDDVARLRKTAAATAATPQPRP